MIKKRNLLKMGGQYVNLKKKMHGFTHLIIRYRVAKMGVFSFPFRALPYTDMLTRNSGSETFQSAYWHRFAH